MRKTFGQCVKEARLAKEYTISDVAKITGLARSTISRIENDHVYPLISTAAILMYHLLIPTDLNTYAIDADWRPYDYNIWTCD